MTGAAMPGAAIDAFRTAYAAHRAGEGRGHAGAELLSLPYLASGPLARQWRVRAATFDAFRKRVVAPMDAAVGRPLRILDLGAGNGWLSYRLACDGHVCTAVDIRGDSVDGLGAARAYLDRAAFVPMIASFDALPLDDDAFDIALFNASLHYATDLAAVLAEAARVTRPGGCVAILDSPFYADMAGGAAMVAEKRRRAQAVFGDRAAPLLALPFVEFLTRDRLARASAAPGLEWRRRRVFYPLWYELRPLAAALRRWRPPSRFDFWTAEAR